MNHEIWPFFGFSNQPIFRKLHYNNAKRKKKKNGKKGSEKVSDMLGTSDNCVNSFTLQRLTSRSFITYKLFTSAYCYVCWLTSLVNGVTIANFQLDKSRWNSAENSINGERSNWSGMN